MDICFYDSEEDSFFTFTENTAHNTGISYEKGLSYIHPLYRSQFIEEFLSTLNGEKRTAKLTIKKLNTKRKKYNTCNITLNAIRVDSNTTIGISIVTTVTNSNQAIINKNNELQDNLSFLLKSSGYQFLEYNPETDKYSITTIDNSHKILSTQQMIESIHPDDCEKATEIISDLKSDKLNNAYIVLRFLNRNTHHYNYYGVNLHSCYFDSRASDKIIGVYHNVTDNLQRLRELEEFKESTTLACEMNNMGFFEYNLHEFEHMYIPYIFTLKYGIDDDNFRDFMDDKSRNTFNILINKFNERSDEIDCNTIKILSPELNKWIYFKFNIIPIRDDINQKIYKYMGFMCEISNV